MSIQDSKVRPVRIDLNKGESYLEIEWSDQQVCRYELQYLREICPCAECRKDDGKQELGSQDLTMDLQLQLKPMPSYEVLNVQPVGAYAIQLVWKDGHQAGIYTWGYLRAFCPKKDTE